MTERRILVAEPVLGQGELDNVVAAMRSGWISSLGAFIPEFERLYRARLDSYREQYRGGLTPEMLRFLDLPRQVLDGMIQRKLELEEAAMIDGASRPKAVRLIIVPLALPGVIAVSIFTFIVAWNDYLFARVLIGTDNLKTLPVGIQDLYESTITDWGMVMAAGVMITIPALLFFLAVQRYLIAGWGTGGVKG